METSMSSIATASPINTLWTTTPNTSSAAQLPPPPPPAAAAAAVATAATASSNPSLLLMKGATSNYNLPNPFLISVNHDEMAKPSSVHQCASSMLHLDNNDSLENSDLTKDEVASSSDDYMSDKAEILSTGGTAIIKQGAKSGIKWKTLDDSDETTSDFDDMDESTDEDDTNDKPGMSDTETRNLLEDVIEDEESDVEDCNTVSSDVGRASRNLQDKGSSESLDDSIYAMTEEQKIYYTKCFNHLMKKTIGHYDINGAIHGANDHVVQFFKRSGLETSKLSKIWSLSDVNEDGYLDLNEFSIAMHLIVLHIKGKIPIPNILPLEIRLPLKRRRDVQRPDDDVTDGTSKMPEPKYVSGAMQTWKQFDFDNSSSAAAQAQQYDQQHHSFSDDHLHVQPSQVSKEEAPRLSKFSDVPPLLVDSRPRAVKTTQPTMPSANDKSSLAAQTMDSHLRIALVSPKGPPPKPPPRPAAKGHARSASLDLNTFPSSKLIGHNQTMGCDLVQRGATLPAHVSMRYQLCSSINRAAPARYPDSNVHPLISQQEITSPNRHFPAPPVPPRPVYLDAAVQTKPIEASLPQNFTYGHELIELNIDMEKRIEELLAEDEKMSGNESKNLDWRERCNQLKKINAQLEMERTKLAQIRLQLEVKLKDLIGSQPTKKPTSL